MSIRFTRRSRHRGFTLVEVIVAISLVAVLMVALVAALVTFGNTGGRLEARALKSDDLRLVHGFLRQSISAAAPLQYVRPADQVTTVWLHGLPDQVEWLGLMPARHGVGGLHHMRLRVDRSAEHDMLMLDYRPYGGVEDVPDWSGAQTHLLVSGSIALDLSYMRAETNEWLPAWEDPMVLPGLMRISVSRDEDVWPDLVVRLLAAEPGVDVSRTIPMRPGR